MWRFDYHIHTVWSDGASTPEEIVKVAAGMGMEAIAITDHDGIDGIPYALEAGRFWGLKVIPGIEIDTRTEDGTTLHLLGYGFDPEHPRLVGHLEFMREERIKRNEKLLRALRDLGCDISYEDLRKGRRNEFIGKPVIARTLQAKGYVDNWIDAFRPGMFLGSPEAKAVRKTKVDTFQALDTILAAGGIAVLAHPIQGEDRHAPVNEAYFAKIDRLIGKLADAGMSGLECYHPDQNKQQTIRFLDMAEKYGLLVSRGTDFHDEDYRNPKPTADYIPSGGTNGYGIYPDHFIKL